MQVTDGIRSKDFCVLGTIRILPEAIHRVGGVGKTQLAIEYMHRYPLEYDVMWRSLAEGTTRSPGHNRRTGVHL